MLPKVYPTEDKYPPTQLRIRELQRKIAVADNEVKLALEAKAALEKELYILNRDALEVRAKEMRLNRLRSEWL